MLTMSTVCSAADGKFIGEEQKIAEIFAQGVFRIGQTDTPYSSFSKHLDDDMKTKLNEAQFESLRDFLRNECGTISDLEFTLLSRTKQGDVLAYRAKATKRAGVVLNIYFSKNKQITKFELGPDDDRKD